MLGYSLVIELVQHFMPGRMLSLGDFIANAAGVVLAAALLKTEALQKLAARIRTFI